MDFEKWLPVIIDGFDEFRYCISDIGRVKSIKTGIYLKHEIDKDGYHRVNLYLGNNVKKHYLVHRLVAMAFIPNPEKYDQVNHIDGNKDNNTVENLEWCNCQQNIQHAIDNGLRRYREGEDNNFANYSKETVIKICEMLQSGEYTVPEISKKLKISISEIRHIKSKKRWKSITKNYNFDNTKTEHVKYSQAWKFIDLAIMKDFDRKTIIQILIGLGLEKDKAVNAYKSRLRTLKRLNKHKEGNV